MQHLFDESLITSYLKDHHLPSFRMKQLQQAIFKEAILEIDEITTLSKELREQLTQDGFVINTLSLEKVIE